MTTLTTRPVPQRELDETDATLDRAAYALAHPESVLPRAYREEPETEWAARAMLTVLLNEEATTR